MNNKNTGIVVAVVAIAAAAICFAIYQTRGTPAVMSVDSPAVSSTSPQSNASVEPASAAPVQPTADNPVVAKVEGQDVLRNEVIEFMKNFPPQMQQMPVEALYPIAVEQVVVGKLVDQRAAKNPELQNDPDVLNRTAIAKGQIVRAVYVEQEVNKMLTPDRVQKAYDKFKTEQGKIEEVHARHILVEKEETAKEIIKKLSEGAKFEDLAKEYSKDPSNKDTGGDLGFFTRETMVKEFADAAFALKKDEVTQTPVKTQFGFHVIQQIDKRMKPVPTLEEMRPALEAEERRNLLNEMVEGWRKDADVTILDINGKPVEAKPEAATAPTSTPAPAPVEAPKE